MRKQSVTSESPTKAFANLADLPVWAARGKDAPDTKRGKFDRKPINPKTGGNASNSKPTTWGTRCAAQNRADKFAATNQPGVGIMLGTEAMSDGWTLAGVDLDGCRDAETGAVAPWAVEVIERLGSYAEASPSRTGLHVLFAAQMTDVAALRSAGLIADWGRSFSKGQHHEIATFFGGKFLTVTDQPHGGESNICPVDLPTLQWLLGDYGPNWGSAEPSAPDHDESGSGHAWRFALALFRQGLSRDEVAEAMAEDSSDAGQWWSRVTQRERDRVLDRTAAQIDGERITDDQLDDLPDPSELSIEDLLGPEPTPDPIAMTTLAT